MTAQVKRRYIVVGLLAGLAACEYPGTVDAAVARFHRRLNAAEDDAIYADAAPEYRREITQHANRLLLTRIRLKMGPLKSSTPTRAGGSVNYVPGGPLVYRRYNTTFAKGEATEEFEWRILRSEAGPLAMLVRYKLESPLLRAE